MIREKRHRNILTNPPGRVTQTLGGKYSSGIKAGTFCLNFGDFYTIYTRTIVLVIVTRTVYPRRLIDAFNSELPVGFSDRYTLDKVCRTQRPKPFDKNKDERVIHM